MEESEKNIDQSWKEKAKLEKETIKEEKEFEPPQADFSFFVTTLSLQASIFLGQLPNPATKKTELNLTQAKFIIDTLGMLKEKTTGNLTADESSLLESLLYELRMQYVSAGENKETNKGD